MVLYALAYAASAALGVWESGRLRKAHVWESLPSRSRYRVAVNVLFPVVLLSWLVLLLPPAVSLARSGTAPSLDSLRLPLMGMVIVVAHAVVGFAIGSFLPRLIATPVVAVVDWVAIAFTRATQPYWLRHVSGQFSDIGFGEVPRFVSLAAPVLLAGGVAVGLMLLWLPCGPRVLRGALALCVAAAGVLGAQHLARDWSHTPPTATGQAPVDCTGVRPRVCVPRVATGNLARTQREAAETLSTLRAAGVPGAAPERIEDVLDGPATAGAGNRVWRLSLMTADRPHEAGYQVMVRALKFRCATVPAVQAHSVWLWAANRTGQVDMYQENRKRDGVTPESLQIESKVSEEVRTVLATSPSAQRTWIRENLDSCTGSTT
ncbi:hypothetical protein [Streptomyces sp. NBC_00102]|uniref:hypothetical protein n=1 Tax=Streptomyces sp. NBC_00102 TaxID=2975652 RepID=UPI00224E30DB|nr:hypothetical protein [Streptomyces sp. NBC_00102]MCX5397688.1 hypothetical protein [Streptomyces sp. NBC_00102]